MYDERLAKIHFVMTFVGIALIFGVQHILGLYGMPRRVVDYLPFTELIIMNQIASFGGWAIGTSFALFLYNMIKSAMYGKPADPRDPFKLGKGVEYYYDYARREPHH
jgi:cytochrome c oxidase subunit 1